MLQVVEIVVRGEAQQEAVGGSLAMNCTPPFIVYLEGDLGTGKTTLVRGFLRQLGYMGRVKSPTYTLLEPYQFEDRFYYHFDLYRLADPRELDYLGVEDLLSRDTLLLIEWPEKGEGVLPTADLVIHFAHQGQARRLRFEAHTEAGADVLSVLEKALENI
jgi:tRNA threonylcarbamoyladenosine biosynthesis protein TsaE